MTTDEALRPPNGRFQATPPLKNGSGELHTIGEIDDQLIDRSLRGDSRAFGRLVCRYQNRLFNSMVYLVRDRAEAEDIVQDALLRCYLKLSTFRRRSEFYVWLYAIALNVLRARKRRKRREVSLEEIVRQRGFDPSREPEPDRCDRNEQAQLAKAALRRLHDRYRVVLVLRDIEGFSYERISKTLRMPIGTVRSRLHRARLELRRQYHRMVRTPA